MQDNRNLLAVRERIKTHLLAQGMIKGYSGAGPSNVERETPILRMHDDIVAISSTSTTPTFSIASSDDDRRPGLSISSIRDDLTFPRPLHSGGYSACLPFPLQLMLTSIRVEPQPSGPAATGSHERCDAPSI